MNQDESGNKHARVPEKHPESAQDSTLEEFERLVSALAMPTYHFRLYVSGNTPRSASAVTNVRRICDQYLAHHYELEVIDIYQQPKETKAADVVVVPTLIKELPLPVQRFVGDMSKTEKIVVGLRLGR
ncbi:MAG TPA: circadian clock KaiB family protein [Acidobacteriaceae bacterium]|nr:circadian clock KaiB family protein [Acidobacteriaceae bacterium]